LLWLLLLVVLLLLLLANGSFPFCCHCCQTVQVTVAVTVRVEYDKKEVASRNVRHSRDYRKRQQKIKQQ